MSTCLGHFPACPHSKEVIACDRCIQERKANGLLYCADVENCAGPGCMDHLAPARDGSQRSTQVDALPDASRSHLSAQKGTPDLATPGSDNAAGVAGTTGPTP